MGKPRKAQIMGEVLKYAIVGVFSIFILIMGYSLINVVRDRACRTELAKFEVDLKDIDKNLRAGEKELQSYNAPCKAESIYFFDLNKKINSHDFKNIPIIRDSLESGGNSNVFVVENGQVRHSFYAGNLEMLYPNYICFVPKFDKISFFAEGTGTSARIRSACNQPECTLIPTNISEEQSKQILQEAVQFGCRNCPNDADREAENIKLTAQNVEVFRRFLFCDGITDVQIIIRPKNGFEVKDFRFYEFIPKTCIDDLNKYLDQSSLEGEFYVKADPLIIWHFSDLGEEKKFSYKLSTDISEECKQAIKGLGVAQAVQQKENLLGQKKLRLKSSSEEFKGGKFEKNLWTSTEYSGNRDNLAYRIISQNTNLIKCEIKNVKILECQRNEDKEGISDVSIEVSDGTLVNRGTITITASKGFDPSVLSHAKIITYGQDDANQVKALGISALRGKFNISSGILAPYKEGIEVLKNSQVYKTPFEDMVQEAMSYAEQSKGSKVTEISIDDFMGWYYAARAARREDVLTHIIDSVKNTNPTLKFGVTIYDEQLPGGSPNFTYVINTSVVPLEQRMRVDVVHLYDHSRPDYTALPISLQSAKEQFPKADIVIGVYNYDRRYDERRYNLPRTEDEELKMFSDNLRMACSLVKDGLAVGIEFFPGAFGIERKYFSRDAEQGRVTESMNQAAISILKTCAN